MKNYTNTLFPRNFIKRKKTEICNGGFFLRNKSYTTRWHTLDKKYFSYFDNKKLLLPLFSLHV